MEEPRHEHPPATARGAERAAPTGDAGAPSPADPPTASREREAAAPPGREPPAWVVDPTAPIPPFLAIDPDDPDGERKELEFTVAHALRKTVEERYAALARILQYEQMVRRARGREVPRDPPVVART
jgi:hypothetical protein